jgi:hypothetical protein
MVIICFLIATFCLGSTGDYIEGVHTSIKDYQSLSNVAAENNLKSLKLLLENKVSYTMSISSNNNNDEREERRRASFALAGTTSTYIVALSLLAVSGIAVICSITTKPMTTAFAQELDNNTTTTATRQPGGGAVSSVCTPTQTGGGGGGQNATTNTTTITMAGSSTDTTAGNDTTTVGGERNLSTSIVKDFIEEACIALQIGDTEGALDLLNQALDELGGGGVGHTR